ncbi:MAG: EAL domain-containing protein [Candidatus Competibacteraceae bacterium]
MQIFSKPGRTIWQQAGAIALIYCLVGTIWIVVSDQVLSLLYKDLAQLTRLQTFKDWLYILVTTVVIFLLGYRQLRTDAALQQDLKALNRLYAVLSDINQAILRIAEPQALFAECCRLAVEDGGFRMAWIGLVDDTNGRVDIVAHAGTTGDYLNKLDILRNDPVRGGGPTGSALRHGRYALSNDIAHDPNMLPWRDDALRLGYRASAAFPLWVAGKVRGVFNLYAGEPGFFDGEELKLLDELASNIAFAMESADREARRRRSVKALRESEERYRLLFEQALDGIGLAEADTGIILDCNAALAALVGRTKSELLGQSHKILHPPGEDWGAVSKTFAQHRSDRAREVLEAQVITPTGECKTVEIKVSIFECNGKRVVQALFHDVTVRKEIEKVLRDSEERFRTIFDSVNDAIFVHDIESGAILDVNRKMCAVYGYTREEALQLDVEALSLGEPPYTQREALAWMKRAAQGEPQIYEWRAKDKQSRLFWVGVNMKRATIKGRDRLLVVVRDITERKQAEEALSKEKERAQVTLHSIGDAVITTDADGIVQYLNPVAERLTGWTTAAAQGQPLAQVFNIVNEETRQAISDPVKRCLAEGPLAGLANHTLLLSRAGQEYAIQDSAAPIRGPRGELFGAVLVFRDITEARRLSQTISYQAAHDDLTGLINRREFERRLQRVLHTARFEQTEHALCYLDLDQFKLINDTCGHIAGDELLRQISSLLKEQIRKRDTLARLGGDEFGVLMEHCSVQQAWRVADALRTAVENFRFIWEDKYFSIGASIGLAPIVPAGGNIATLLSAADAACYMAKEQGRNRIHIYQPDDAELAQRHGEMQWATRIPRALEEGRFRLFWQPIVPVIRAKDQRQHFELLLRLEDEIGHLIPPGAFLASAERYNLSTRLDRWVINAAFEWLLAHPHQLRQLGLCTINLSGHSMSDDSFLAFIMHQFEVTAIPPAKICFEVTETAAIANLTMATQFIKALKERGCCFALDDFGSGLSSFAYLKNLPVDFLKIDGTFVKDIADDPTSCAIVKSINEIGQIMGKQTVAEFVENEPILEKLRQMGVNYAQGYLIGRPMPLKGMP